MAAGKGKKENGSQIISVLVSWEFQELASLALNIN